MDDKRAAYWYEDADHNPALRAANRRLNVPNWEIFGDAHPIDRCRGAARDKRGRCLQHLAKSKAIESTRFIV